MEGNLISTITYIYCNDYICAPRAFLLFLFVIREGLFAATVSSDEDTRLVEDVEDESFFRRRFLVPVASLDCASLSASDI